MFVIITLTIFVILFVYVWMQQRFNYWKDRGFLSAPTVFPFGSIKGFGSTLHASEGIDAYYKAFKNKAAVLGLYFFVAPTLMIMDLDLVKNVLVRDFSSFHDRGFYYNKEDDPLSSNMVRITTQQIETCFSNYESGLNFTADIGRSRMERETSKIESNIYVAQFKNDVWTRGCDW